MCISKQAAKFATAVLCCNFASCFSPAKSFWQEPADKQSARKKIHIYDNITYYIIILFLYIENISDFLLG